MKTVIRYLAYIGFWIALVPIWAFFMLLFTLGDPTCRFEPGGCSMPEWVRQLLAFGLFFGGIPGMVLLFLPYRAVIRRALDVPDRTWRGM